MQYMYLSLCSTDWILFLTAYIWPCHSRERMTSYQFDMKVFVCVYFYFLLLFHLHTQQHFRGNNIVLFTPRHLSDSLYYYWSTLKFIDALVKVTRYLAVYIVNKKACRYFFNCNNNAFIFFFNIVCYAAFTPALFPF